MENREAADTMTITVEGLHEIPQERTGRRHTTLRRRIVGGFLLTSLLLGGLIGVSDYFIHNISQSYLALIGNQAVSLQNTEAIRADALTQAAGIRGYMLTDKDAYLRQAILANQDAAKLIASTAALTKDPAARNQLHTLSTLNSNYANQYETIGSMSDKKTELTIYEKNILPLGQALEKRAESLAVRGRQVMLSDSQAKAQSANFIIGLMLLLTVVILIAAVASGLVVSKRLSKPIVELARAAHDIADGDLSSETPTIRTRDEVQELSTSFSVMLQNLREVISSVANSAAHVAQAAADLRHGAKHTTTITESVVNTTQEMTIGAEKQAVDTTQTAKAIQSTAKATEAIDDKLKKVSKLAATASSNAYRGRDSAEQALERMRAIENSAASLGNRVRVLEERSQQINQMATLITDLSAQTNLLALNASIEAARAGDSGKGFAVVALEVKRLAEESTHSAQQIRDFVHLIHEDIETTALTAADTEADVALGITAVNSTSTTFSEILESILQVSQDVLSVSANTTQVASTAQQAVEAISAIADTANTIAGGSQQISAAAQEQLSSVQDVHSAAENLLQMADVLKGMVSRFRV